MQEPSDLHVDVMFFEALGQEHEVVVMAPDHIPFLVVLIDDVCKHLIGSLVRVELRLEVPRGRQPVLLRQPQVVEERPQYVVAVPVVVLVHNLLIQEHWYASLLGERTGESPLADLVGDIHTRPSDPLRVDILHAEKGADEAAGADLQGPLILAAAIGGDGETVGHNEEALLHAAEAEAAEPVAWSGERRARGVAPRPATAGIVHVGVRAEEGSGGLSDVRFHGVGGRVCGQVVAPGAAPEHAVDAVGRAAAVVGEGRGVGGVG